MSHNDFLLIYSDVFITEGAIKITIVDPSRGKVFELPKSFSQLIHDLKKCPISEVRLLYDDNLDPFIQFILENDLGMITSTPKQFPDIDRSFSSPEYINNAILDFYPSESYDVYGTRLQKLDNLGCKFYEFRMYLSLDLKIIESIFKNVQFNSLKSINIHSIHSSESDNENYIRILRNFPFIKRIFIFNSDSNSRIKSKEIMDDQRLYYLTDKLDNKSCGKVSFHNLFIRSTEQIVENISHNSCLHKKISVDSIGNIRNCPSMVESYGNIDDNILPTIINNTNFTKLWDINKDQIEVCKDCEFRYLCTDCRAYTERTHYNKYNIDISKPLKCGYNPYTGEWSEWSLNPLKKEAIKYYSIEK
ncbi:grasp-with-spasm system SPASM domain peptide maturase [Weeksellaceae bacterium A-14]